MNDKKSTLVSIPSSEQMRTAAKKSLPDDVVVLSAASTPPESFVPREREDTDKPVDDEKYEQRIGREKREAETETTIVARMKPLVQLGVDAGRAAEKVKELRRQLLSYQRSVTTYTQKLADAEALLTMRLDELKKADL